MDRPRKTRRPAKTRRYHQEDDPIVEDHELPDWVAGAD